MILKDFRTHKYHSKLGCTYSHMFLHASLFVVLSPGMFIYLFYLYSIIRSIHVEQRKRHAGRAVKGSSWAGPKVVLALPWTYARPGLDGPKPLEGLHYLGPYPTLKGQGRAKVGLRASKQKQKKLFFF